MISGREPAVAPVTFIGSLKCMPGANMACQGALLGEFPTAVWAGIRLFSGVQTDVFLEVRALAEAAVAGVARKGALVPMGQHVPGEAAAGGEGLVAFNASPLRSLAFFLLSRTSSGPRNRWQG